MRFVPAILAAAVLAVLGLGWWEKMDVATTRYATLQEAHAAGAFQRGWLPPYLPESTRTITETNDLDRNLGAGSFEFSPADYPAFVANYTPASAEVAARWREHTAKGCAIFAHSENGTRWILALHPDGKGIYRVE